MMIRHCDLCKGVVPTDGDRVAFSITVYLSSGGGKEYREVSGDANIKCFPADLLRLVEVYGRSGYSEAESTLGATPTTSVPVMEDTPPDAREHSFASRPSTGSNA